MTNWVTLPTNLVDQTPGHLSNSNQMHLWANAAHAKRVSTNITLSDSYGIVIVDSSAAARVITLPSAASNGQGGYLIIRDGANTVTVNRSGTDTFNDADTSKVLSTDGASLGVVGFAGLTKWYITGERGAVA